jgi:hypothetical protein
LDKAVQWIDTEWDTGNHLDNASYKYMEDEEYTEDDFGEKEYLIEDPRGFDVVARHLANKLSKDTLLLSHLVTKIRTSDGKVTVETS